MDIQTGTIVITGIGVLLAAINQIYTSRQANAQRQTEIQTRQAEPFMNMYARWSSQDFQKAHALMITRGEYSDAADFTEKFGPSTNLEDYSAFMMMATFYKGIGVLIEQELIDLKLVDRLLHNNVQRFWSKLDPLIRETRQQMAARGEAMYYSLFDSVEQPYQNMQHIGQQPARVA